MTELTHLGPDGRARMVDVSEKPVTRRMARAAASVSTRPDVIDLINAGALPKGAVAETARIAGIMAAKRTSELVPLCHPLPLTAIDVTVSASGATVAIEATVATTAQTGVEMEALTAAAVAALTVYDMIKAVDPAARIDDIRVLRKEGGKTGTWVRP